MPSQKRKKKPASNAARGFTTTSIPSKSKVDDNETEDIADLLSKLTTSDVPGNEPIDSSTPRITGELQTELYDFTSQESELHTEEFDLQLLIEEYGVRSKKDASRQVTRVTTERRVLRAQSERLDIGYWLSDNLIQGIFDLINLQIAKSNSDDVYVREHVDSESSDSSLVIKLWTLQKILRQLEFKEDLIGTVLHSLLKRRQTPIFTVSKDSLWGLDECFDILALTCGSGEILQYGFHVNDVRSKMYKSIKRDKRCKGYEPSKSSSPKIAPMQSTSTEESNAESESNFAGVASDRDTSESDENLEPEALVKKFLSLQSQIIQLQPDILSRELTKNKSRFNKQKTSQNPKVAKLLTKLNKIQSDILFDEDEANAQWSSLRNEITRESAERRKYQLNRDRKIEFPTPMTSSCKGASTFQAVEDDEHLEMIGNLFSSLSENTPDSNSGISSQISPSTIHQTVTIRDFGKWSGISPRRVFEEACKARDAACRIAYNVVSESAFSVQHSLIIDWSFTQDLSELFHDPSIMCHATESNVKFQMIKVSTPDVLQSESYISTAALYAIFSHSPKEQKTYLRLPPRWRDLWLEICVFEKKENDAADRNALRRLQDMVATSKSEAHFGQPVPRATTKNSFNGEQSRKPNEAGNKSLNTANSTHSSSQLWMSISSSSSFCEILKARAKLPIWGFKERILRVVEDNQVVIVCGETGCGKSTQIPAFILEQQLSKDRPCKVYCTEPRRISAISLARRVSEELGEQRIDLGTSRSLVGYAIRLESKVTNETRLVFATTGVVMRMLEHSSDLSDITHLILDEVHERLLDNDFLFIILRKLLLRRPTLKVILMSATVDAGRFSIYFGGAPVINVPGRTFPVETKYLEDVIEITNFEREEKTSSGYHDIDYSDDDSNSNTLAHDKASQNLERYSAKTRKTLTKLDEYRIEYTLIVQLLEVVALKKEYFSFSKAILVFLPAFLNGWNIYALHSTVAMEEQERAFRIPPPGARKIILATNIAETGITIPDVTCVIDTGKHKEMRFDERRQLSRLVETFISRANAKQRRGRCGRVQNGMCFHLFTKARHDELMLEEQRPEMLRLSLQDLILRVKICKLGEIEETLSESLDPPSSKNIQRAINALVDVKALTAKEDLTPLGRQLARLPLDVFLGKLLLFGAFYECLDAVLSIAAILSSKSPFSAPMGFRSRADEARLSFKKGDSDLLTVYNAYSAWRKVCQSASGSEQLFCRKNFLSSQILSNIEELKAQLLTSIGDAGFVILNEVEKSCLHRVRFHSDKRRFVEVPGRYMNNNANEVMLNSVIAWSFYPKLLIRDGKGWKNVVNNQHVSLHPTSVNKGLPQSPKWLSYYHIMQSSNKFYNAHETSAVESITVALGCGDAEFKMYAGVIVIDGNRIRFAVDSWREMLAVKTLRTQMRQIMAQFFRNPGRELTPEQEAWKDIWRRVFEEEKENAQVS